MNLSDSYYRVINKAALEKLANLDILFVEASTIDVRKEEVRGYVYYMMDSIEILSYLNSFI